MGERRKKKIRQFALSVAGAALLVLALQSAAGAETLLERGTYLVRGVVACGNCHSTWGDAGPRADMEMAGGNPIMEKDGKTAFTSNITPDDETGIGRWTDEQIIIAIRDGKRPDGSIIGPPMPFGLYRHMSDRDVEAIVAYLHTVKPIKNQVPKSEYTFPLPPAYGPPVGSVPEPDRGDKVAYGAYLAGPLGHCIECHSPLVNGIPDVENRLGAGGFPFEGPWGVVLSRNITPHPEDGIGEWTDDEIIRAITQAISRDGNALGPPMGYPYYANIKRDDLEAIVAYLRSIKPLTDPE